MPLRGNWNVIVVSWTGFRSQGAVHMMQVGLCSQPANDEQAISEFRQGQEEEDKGIKRAICPHSLFPSLDRTLSFKLERRTETERVLCSSSSHYCRVSGFDLKGLHSSGQPFNSPLIEFRCSRVHRSRLKSMTLKMLVMEIRILAGEWTGMDIPKGKSFACRLHVLTGGNVIYIGKPRTELEFTGQEQQQE